MRKLIFGGLCLAFLLASAVEAEAQFNRKQIKKNNKRMSTYRGKKGGFGNKVYNAVGFSVSALNYYGDIAPRPSRVSTDISFTRPALGLSLTHRFGPRYSLMAQFMYGTLKGSDVESADQGDAEECDGGYIEPRSDVAHDAGACAFRDWRSGEDDEGDGNAGEHDVQPPGRLEDRRAVDMVDGGHDQHGKRAVGRGPY